MLGLLLSCFSLLSLPHVSELLHLSSAGAVTACGWKSTSEIAAPAPHPSQAPAAGSPFWKWDSPLWERADPQRVWPEPCCPRPCTAARAGSTSCSPGDAFPHSSRGYKYPRSRECTWEGWSSREEGAVCSIAIPVFICSFISVSGRFSPCWAPRSCCSAQAAAAGQDPRCDPAGSWGHFGEE